MNFLSLINPEQKRWVALFTLLCWVVPFLGVMSFLIFAPLPVANQPNNKGVTAPEQVVDKTVAVDREAEPGLTAETERHQVAATPPPAPQEQPKTVSTTAETSNSSAGRQADGIDLNLLARVIYAEARGEPFEGQVAVGAVLVNRVRNPKFPNDLWSVVFKKGEFCTVRDGQVWLEPDATAYRAARMAKAGWDPTNGALYFYNPSKTTSAWIWSRTVTTRIGRHVFAV